MTSLHLVHVRECYHLVLCETHRKNPCIPFLNAFKLSLRTCELGRKQMKLRTKRVVLVVRNYKSVIKHRHFALKANPG